MLTVFKRNSITNPSNQIRQINSLKSDFLKSLLQSQNIGEGVSGFEQISNSDFTQLYNFTHPTIRINNGEKTKENWKWLKDHEKNMNAYEMYFEKPTFFPLYIEEGFELFNKLSNCVSESEGDEIFIQVLFKKANKEWKQTAFNQYKDYINHNNDEPFENNAVRKIQNKVLSIFDKLTDEDESRERVMEVEDKMLEEGFHFQIRLLIMSENKRIRKAIAYSVEEQLKEMDYFNQLRLVKTNTKTTLEEIIERRMSISNQIMSESELLSLLTSEKIVTIKEEPKEVTTPQVVKETKDSSLIEMLPIGEKKEREVNEEIVAELPMALKKAKAIKTNHIEILDVELGATVQKITCKIPDDVVYSDIKGKYEDIKAVLGSEVSVIQGNEPNTVTFLIPCSEREIIYLKELLENEDFLEFAKDNALPFVCGVDMHNQAVYKCLTKAPHLLIAGATNSGKSVFMNALLITLILLRRPDELRIFLIDPKKVELSQYQGFAHVEKVIIDMDEAIKTLETLVNEMEDRYEKLHKASVKNISGFNKKGKEKIPYIICAIDEYNDLKMLHPEVEDYIERLGQKARASGIHLILATQRPDKEVMSGVVKTNLPSRISFKLDNTNEYRTVFGTGIPYKNLLGFGDGVVKFVGQSEEFIRFQSPAITLDDNVEEETYDKIKKFYKGEAVSNLELKEPDKEEEVKEDPIDQLKRIVALKGETRTSELQKEMGIRINKVSELRMQLVEEGWLEKQGNKFVVVANEDELSKWRD